VGNPFRQVWPPQGYAIQEAKRTDGPGQSGE
jgi:hypothetical protein